MTALGLSYPLLSLAVFLRMSDLLTGAQRDEIIEAGIYANSSIAGALNCLRLGVDKQTQIVARCALDEPAAFDLAFRNPLFVKPDFPQSREA